ncbi:PilZ domain-containing protein [Marinobacter mangrovi]|uniref:PilZ domain-containing protein n=1 Tax=Marinobacter mangrovi TaxID=2803918 RepID=UPI0019339A01|nr:PilZ domain-containing protein [Marinobacter mangrovi]
MSGMDYEFGNQPETENEQRREFRLTGRVTISLELESAEPDVGGKPRFLRCYTSDLSARGIRIVASEPFPDGAILPATVELVQAGQETLYPLMVEVVWCRPGDDGTWQVGLQVLESDDTAVLEWLETMIRVLEDD